MWIKPCRLCQVKSDFHAQVGENVRQKKEKKKIKQKIWWLSLNSLCVGVCAHSAGEWGAAVWKIPAWGCHLPEGSATPVHPGVLPAALRWRHRVFGGWAPRGNLPSRAEGNASSPVTPLCKKTVTFWKSPWVYTDWSWGAWLSWEDKVGKSRSCFADCTSHSSSLHLIGEWELWITLNHILATISWLLPCPE